MVAQGLHHFVDSRFTFLCIYLIAGPSFGYTMETSVQNGLLKLLYSLLVYTLQSILA